MHSQESKLEKAIEDRILSGRCFVCDERISGNLAKHIVANHGENELTRAILKLKRVGYSDVSIKNSIGVSFQKLQDIFTKNYGKNIQVIKQLKRISHMQPRNFELETTTVWSFKNRGSWCTHNGSFRGNWSPYVPRNLILRYTDPSDTVLDCFVGGGTTAVEAKLLGRKCIAVDINPGAIGIARQNIDFPLLVAESNGKSIPAYEPKLNIGDARDLENIESDSIDFICTHPPYADIIEYSPGIDGDLSHLPVNDFVKQMKEVSKELYRVLKPNGKCAVLIGDSRKSKHVVPIGFKTIQQFLDTGFLITDFIIKRQHNCKTTGFWYNRSIKYNFLLLAHEYLPVFGKFSEKTARTLSGKGECIRAYTTRNIPVSNNTKNEKNETETTTVWVFSEDCLRRRIRENLIGRFTEIKGPALEILMPSEKEGEIDFDFEGHSLLYIRPREKFTTVEGFLEYKTGILPVLRRSGPSIREDSYVVIETHDIRLGDILCSTAIRLWQNLQSFSNLQLKEIVIIESEPNGDNSSRKTEEYSLVHRYLLIYRGCQHHDST